jgi:lysophospholipid acyltransferase (LPLAT)-like uncharacterized protein
MGDIIKNFLYQSVYPGLGFAFFRSIRSSLRIKVYGEKEVLELKKAHQKIIYVLWHGRQFLTICQMANQHIGVMVSTSRDGMLQANILKKYNYTIIPGSSAKSPVRATFRSLKLMRKGNDLLLAIDGPTGPIFKAKPGALFLAKKTKAVIVPVSFSVKFGICLSSWDRYLLPLPFSPAVFIYGKPFLPSDQTDEKSMDRETIILENHLNEVYSKADALCGPQRILDFSK